MQAELAALLARIFPHAIQAIADVLNNHAIDHSPWQGESAATHAEKALRHLALWSAGDESDDHPANSLSRALMAFEVCAAEGSFDLGVSPSASEQVRHLKPTLTMMGWPADKIDLLAQHRLRPGEKILMIGYGSVKIACPDGTARILYRTE